MQKYYPFDTGSGANVTEIQWSNMAQHWLGTGVLKGYLNDFQVYGDSTGMQVKVKTGQAWMKGHFFESDAEEVLSIGAADATNPRIDRVIIRLDWNTNSIELAVLQGVPAVSPSVPALTQNTARWEIQLAQVRVNANVLTVVAGDVTDDRLFADNMYPSGLINYPQNVSFLLNLGSGTLSIPALTDTLLPITGNQNGGYGEGNFVDGTYTVPEDGVYFFYCSAYAELVAGAVLEMKIYKNGQYTQPLDRIRNDNTVTTGLVGKGLSIQKLKKNDTIKFYVYCSEASSTVNRGFSRAMVAKLS